MPAWAINPAMTSPIRTGVRLESRIFGMHRLEDRVYVLARSPRSFLSPGEDGITPTQDVTERHELQLVRSRTGPDIALLLHGVRLKSKPLSTTRQD